MLLYLNKQKKFIEIYFFYRRYAEIEDKSKIRELKCISNGYCEMNTETRKCTACRYKACIAAGMDMKNSNEKFGCHTSDFKSKGPDMKTNLAFKIRDSFRTFQNSITQNRQTLFEWNRAYVKFKEECMDYGVFLNGDMSTDIDKNEYSFREAFLLKIMSLLYATLFKDQTCAALGVIIVPEGIDGYQNIVEGFMKSIAKIQEKLQNNQFTEFMKIYIFIHVAITVEFELNDENLEKMTDALKLKKILFNLLYSEMLYFRFQYNLIENENTVFFKCFSFISREVTMKIESSISRKFKKMINSRIF